MLRRLIKIGFCLWIGRDHLLNKNHNTLIKEKKTIPSRCESCNLQFGPKILSHPYKKRGTNYTYTICSNCYYSSKKNKIILPLCKTKKKQMFLNSYTAFEFNPCLHYGD